MLMNMFAFF